MKELIRWPTSFKKFLDFNISMDQNDLGIQDKVGFEQARLAWFLRKVADLKNLIKKISDTL